MKHLFVTAAVVGLVANAARADDAKVRGIVRTGVDNKGNVHGDIKNVTQLVKATSIAYKLLLLEPNGAEKQVDEKKHIFTAGQQFKLEIESDSEMFVYVLHEGPDKKLTLLVPDAYDDGAPKARKGQKSVVPADGTYFEVVPPAGTEKLMVYASPKPLPASMTPKDVQSLDQKQQIQLRSEWSKTLSQAHNKLVTPGTGSDLKQVAEANRDPGEDGVRFRGMAWMPEKTEPGEGKTVFVGTYDPKVDPNLAIEIEVKSK